LGRTLSGGEQQMLAIGRVLMLNPKIMLIDELSLGLAPLLVDKLMDAVKKLHESGITIILVEQNIYRSLEISDRAYVLQNGKVVLSGNSKILMQNEEIKQALIGI
jgi:branched-chain amino acid transport system ATP-binding protein